MPTKRMRVLVAEDDDVNARVARAMLERFGCSVDLAISGTQAIEHFRDHAYDRGRKLADVIPEPASGSALKS